MSTRVRDEQAPEAGSYELAEVRKWQVRQAELCGRMMDSLVEQVLIHSDKMGSSSGSLSLGREYEQAEGAGGHQVKEDVKRLRRELLLLAKSYGWSYGH